MLTAIELILAAPPGKRFSASIGSLLQGALMERLDSKLAASLHQPALRPYSQYCCYRGEELIWRIAALTPDAAAAIIEPLLSDSFSQITLRDKAVTLTIKEKSLLHQLSYQQFADRFFLLPKPPRQALLRFITPASFRSDDSYQIYPSVWHILQNLYNRWNTFAGRYSLADPDALQHMSSHICISGYRLQMTPFSLEGVRIPAFQGDLRLSINGPDALCRLVILLLAYCEFAGIGIKTAIGMGGCRAWACQRGKPPLSLLPGAERDDLAAWPD